MSAQDPPTLDQPVLSTMNRLLGDFAVNAPVRDLARDAGLSESRFSHVFRRDVGSRCGPIGDGCGYARVSCSGCRAGT